MGTCFYKNDIVYTTILVINSYENYYIELVVY